MLKKTKKNNRTGFEWCSRALVNSPVHIGLCTSRLGFERELKRLGVSKPDDWLNKSDAGRVHQFEDQHDGLALVVCIEPCKDRDMAITTIVHEAVHVWQFIRDYIGERSPSVEFEAYSVETIFSTLREAYDAQVGTTRKQRKSA